MDVPACSGPGLGPASCRHSHGSPARGQRSHGHIAGIVQALHVQAQLRETRGGGRSASMPMRSSASLWCGRCSQPCVQSTVFSCAATSSPTAHPSARPQHPPSAHPELIHLLRGLGRRRPHFWGSQSHEHILSHVSCRLCSGLVPGCFWGATDLSWGTCELHGEEALLPRGLPFSISTLLCATLLPAAATGTPGLALGSAQTGPERRRGGCIQTNLGVSRLREGKLSPGGALHAPVTRHMWP